MLSFLRFVWINFWKKIAFSVINWISNVAIHITFFILHLTDYISNTVIIAMSELNKAHFLCRIYFTSKYLTLERDR